MTTTTERADAKKPYGNVTYADPKHGKYPIDTEAHARAALVLHHRCRRTPPSTR